jgi:uncharacterized protein (UPF0303 family)
MHTKIITQQNDPNFLTHVIWHKTSLVVQHIHLALLWNLSCAILKKKKHNSRIIISDIYKIMINSQDVYFGITRQCAQDELKNIKRFNKKNHLGRFRRDGKTFL